MWYKVKKIYQWSNLVRPKWKPWANTLAYYPLEKDGSSWIWWTTLTMSWITFTTESTWKWYAVFNGTATGNGGKWAYVSVSDLWYDMTFSFWSKTSWNDGNRWDYTRFRVGSYNRQQITSMSNPNWYISARYNWNNNTTTNYAIPLDNVWHYYCITYWSNWIRIYLDNIEVATSSYTSTDRYSWTMYIWRTEDAGYYWFNWWLSEFIIEKKARSDEERTNYYNQTKSNYWL